MDPVLWATTCTGASVISYLRYVGRFGFVVSLHTLVLVPGVGQVLDVKIVSSPRLLNKVFKPE